MDDINCPYCGESQDIDHDDGVGYDENKTFSQMCRYCRKTFVYTASCLWTYDAQMADCLNGADHDYQPTHTYPKEYTKMRCSMCDDERDPTKEERIKYGLDIES